MSAVLEAREPSVRYLVAVEPTLVRQFGLLATAPGGVARVRQFILKLAIQGKLLPPLDRDLSSESCCDATPSAGVDHALAPLPKAWVWTSLGEIVEVLDSQRQPVKKDDRKPGPYPYFGASGVVDYVAAYIFDESLVLVGEDGAKWGAGDATAFMISGKSWVNNHAHVLRPRREKVADRYLVIALTAMDLSPYVTGMTVPKLNQGRLVSIPIPLPPLAEQALIVARVDELMRLCDALEAHGRLEAEQHARLLGTLLDTLTDSSTPEELAANWQRVAEHFDLLLDRPEAVDALEQTILQLAVRGLLVPQDPSVEPATVLIEQIRAARAGQLADASRLKARAELPDVEQDEWPFEPPSGWTWTRFGEVTQVSGGVTLGRKGAIVSPVSRPYLRVANVQRWKLALDSMKDIVIDEAELPRYQLAEGDLLITEGGDWDKVGRTAIWRSELPGCLHQNHVFKARGYTTTWNPSWAELYLNLDVARAYFAASAKQTTNLASINMTELRHCLFPLPPLSEQARIVARVTELRRLCADLRQRLTARQTTQSHLAEALVDSATT